MTATTLTLSDFLLARIAEDVAAARAATQGRWFWSDPETSEFPQGALTLEADQGTWRTCSYYCTWSGAENMHRGQPGQPGHEHRDTETVVDSTGYDAWSVVVSDENAAHIARHDPASVLAECEAKRRIVEMHQPTPLLDHVEVECTCGFDDHRSQWCAGCGVRVYDEGEFERPYAECPTLRLLALPYAAHPDFNPEWAP